MKNINKKVIKIFPNFILQAIVRRVLHISGRHYLAIFEINTNLQFAMYYNAFVKLSDNT
jgi:hypothetical protein